MKILKSKLQDALKGLAKVVGVKASIPVLKHVIPIINQIELIIS